MPPESYAAWASTYEWKQVYGHEFLYGGPLFVHQYSHIWVDFRDIQNDFARDHGIDYFENSRRATYVQREYAIRNPLEFAGYGEHFWGLTASDGPGWTTRRMHGVERSFFDYVARGAPYGPDDGTVAPWAVVASLPFAPEIRNGYRAIMRAMEICHRQHARLRFSEADLVLHPVFRRSVDTLDFDARRECLAAGQRAVRNQRTEIRALLEQPVTKQKEKS